MFRFKATGCPPTVMVIATFTAATGVFFAVANLAEQHRESRVGFEALLIIPLLLCFMLAARVNRS